MVSQRYKAGESYQPSEVKSTGRTLDGEASILDITM
jgi:hypothetical protein